MSNDREKEIELAEDLQGKLDKIEGKKTRKSRSKVSQEVKSPADADRQAVVGEMNDMKHKLETIDSPTPVVSKDIPDPKMHKQISFVKSAFRIAAGASLGLGYFPAAGILFIIAEVLGVAEEVV